MRTLRRYISREIVVATLFVFAGLLVLFSLFDLLSELQDVGRGQYRLTRMLAYVALSIPGHAYEVFPIAVLMGTLFALAQFVANSEYTVMRAAGVSVARATGMLLRLGAVLAVITFLLGEFVAPASQQFAQRLRARSIAGIVAQDFRSGLWLKDEQVFVNIKQVLPDGALAGVRIFEFDDAHRLRVISVAERGDYAGENRWRLTQVAQTAFEGERTRAETIGEAVWRSVLDPAMVDMLMVVPEQMSVWYLGQYIQHLRDNKQRTSRHELALWLKLTYPFAVMVMMVLALPFAYFQRRAGSLGARVFTGVMLGLAFYALNRLFGHLALLRDWPPMLGAVLPTAIFLAVAVAMLWWVERR